MAFVYGGARCLSPADRRQRPNIAGFPPIRYRERMKMQSVTRVPASLDLVANTTTARRAHMALADMRDGFGLYRLAFKLGWLDIKLRYRGSILGPFWLTLSTAVMILSMGVLYAELFHLNVRQYLPYLGLSLVLWNSIGAMVTDACVCFTSAEGTIRSTRMPFSVHAIRALVRNALVLAHNAIVIVCVFAYFNKWPGGEFAISFIGLAIWLVDAIAVCLLLGTFCARFRDVPPIIASIMQIGFFLTPIIWQPETLGTGIVYFVIANPFYSLLTIVRDPLLGEFPSTLIWIAALSWSGMLWIAACVVFTRVRGRLAFWI
jgi:lipopolysaccharide transport system permease protein